MPSSPRQKSKTGNDFFRRFKAEGRPVIIAEGDSWFDYQVGYANGNLHPKRDVLDNLACRHKYAIWRVSKAGDTLGNMVYGPSINKTLDAIRRENPAYFLFSGGGNDVAGPEMAPFLNHKQGNQEVIRKEAFRQFVRDRLERAFRRLLSDVASVRPQVKVFLHGYDYPIPDGRAVVKLPWGGIVGPWLLPVFKGKGILDQAEQDAILHFFIDEFNEMLARLAKQVRNCNYIDCRGVLDHSTKEWANELHPTTNRGFPKIAARFDSVIQSS